MIQTAFPEACRRWRQHRKMSQLELALAAEVSQRHVSWLETGRSQPSRDMVLRLSAAMELPLRDRNVLLNAAGFAAVYRESGLTEPAMQPVRAALTRILDHHNPLPAIVIDRSWNVVMLNESATRLFDLIGNVADLNAALGGDDSVNLALLTLHPDGLRRFISNWDEAAPPYVQRLKSEAAAATDPALRERFEAIIALADFSEGSYPGADPLLPVLPLELNLHGVRLSLFSTISTFGTPQDITTDELRIEAFYPADDDTIRFFDSQ